MSNTYDVIIIGGGVMGCSTAFQLAGRGVKVAVLERNSVGMGATGRSSAIIRQHYSNELTARMALYCLKFYQNFKDHVGGECDFRNVGFVVVVSNDDQEGLEANVKMQQGVGIKTELLSAEALKEIMPSMETADLSAGAYEPEGGYADPHLTVTSLADAARRLGADVFQDTPVTGLRFASGKVVGVDTPNGPYDAPVVVNCTGAWSGPLTKMAGFDLPLNPCRIQVTFFRRPEGHKAPHPVVGDFTRAVYFRPETGDLTLTGLIDPEEANYVVDPDDFKESIDREFILDAGERMIARYPIMEQSENTGGYSSLYDITPDWHPIIDELPSGSGFYNCSGFSGHGFKLSPAIGLMVADMVTGVSDPLFSPHLFRYSRFAENDPVRGQYDYSILG